MTSLTVDFHSILTITDEQFYRLCSQNPEIKFERTADRELIIMSPTGGGTGKRNSEILIELGIWNRQQRSGVIFDSSTGFILPNGSIRSPDVAWITNYKWEQISPQEQENFIALCPDFVIELRSQSDRLKLLQEKMAEYIENGTRLGWLINRKDREVEIYRAETETEVLHNPTNLLGEDLVSGFVLNLELIW
jgi:Uma2 family endonuclease